MVHHAASFVSQKISVRCHLNPKWSTFTHALNKTDKVFCSVSGALTSLAALMQLLFKPGSCWFPAKQGSECWWMLMNSVEHLVTEEPARAGIAWNDRRQSLKTIRMMRSHIYRTCKTAASHSPAVLYGKNGPILWCAWHLLMSFVSPAGSDLILVI